MSASDALTIWMLSTAMKAPSVAPITAIQVFAETAGVALSGVAAALGASISAETALRAGWNVVMAVSSCLADAGCMRRSGSLISEIAGRVVGRQQREFQTAGRRQAVDVAPQFGAMEAVDLDLDRLAVADMGELGFLEIRHHIDPNQRNDRHQLRSGLHELTDAERTGADRALNGRRNLCVGQVQRRLRLDRPGAIELRHRL